MKYTQMLYEKVSDIWRQTHQHPFVIGLGKGDLPVESFIRYMKQDYVYLIDFAKLFALGSVKATNIETMAFFQNSCMKHCTERWNCIANTLKGLELPKNS